MKLPGSNFIKISSITLLISSCIYVVFFLSSSYGIPFLIESSTQTESGALDALFMPIVMTMWFLTIISLLSVVAPSIIAGFLGLKHINDTSKSTNCLILGIVILITTGWKCFGELKEFFMYLDLLDTLVPYTLQPLLHAICHFLAAAFYTYGSYLNKNSKPTVMDEM